MSGQRYILGPMRGYPNFNAEAFFECEDTLRRAYGYSEIFNPARYELDAPQRELAYYMQRDLAELCKSVEAIALPGWEYSEGAILEAFVATYLKIPVIDWLTMTKIKPHPAFVSFGIVNDIMKLGLKKHAADSWRTEPEDNHIDKGLRHGLSYKLIRDGNSPPDTEPHLHLALCRLAFAAAQGV